MNQNRLTLTEVQEGDWPELFQELATTAEGLSADEAALRLKRYGPNEIKEKSRHPLIAFLAFLGGPIPWMIEVAAILAAVIHHWETFAIIMAMLLVNAGVGFWQRQKADHAIALLELLITDPLKVLVYRVLDHRGILFHRAPATIA